MGEDERDFLELLEAARDALGRVLRETDPGTGITCHHAYNDLTRSIDRKRAAAERDVETSESKAAWREQVARRSRWKRTPRAERDRLAIELIDDQRLTVRELSDRLYEALPDYAIYEPDVRTVLARLFAAGELERVGEEWQGKVRYRYFRKVNLEGPIAALDRIFHDGADEEAR